MSNLIQNAEAHCKTQRERFTAPRRDVLLVLAHAAKPMGAYEILAAMPEGTKPPTVYRALEFWAREGIIHHIASLNAYAACRAGHRHTGAQFTLCDDCGDVAETALPPAPPAQGTGFMPSRWSTEIHGTCARCSNKGRTKAA